MSDFDKQNGNEPKILRLPEEHPELTEDEQMKLTADKYRAKPKIEDIFSHADKRVRLKNESPLDIEEADGEQPSAPDENGIVGEMTAATMQASLLMDGEEPAIPSQQPESSPIVTLSPEYDAGTQLAGEVLDEVEQFRDNTHIENVDYIDVGTEDDASDGQESTKPSENTQETASPAADAAQIAERIVAKVPVYRPYEPENLLNVKAGRFSEVVAQEYEEYIQTKNASIRSQVIRPVIHREKPKQTEEETPVTDTQEKILGAFVGFFSKDDTDDTDTRKKENEAPVEDYTGREDEKSIKFELKENTRKLFFRSLISGVIALVSVILTFVVRIFPDAIISAIPVAPAAYAVFNLLLVGSSVALNRVAMANGLSALTKFKGNSDTAVAVAGGAALLQTVATFFGLLGDMSKFSVNYYCVIVLLAFFANNAGKLMMVLRVKDNFRFVSARGQKYAAKIYNNENVANKMLSGTVSEKNLIAYQHKTKFPSNFLKISYAPDPSEELASKLAPITTAVAIGVAVLYGLIKFSFTDAFSALALITALAIPISTLLAVNLPVRKLCKSLHGYGAMMAGYPSIKQFCDSTAIMLDAGELFPAESIDLEGIKTFATYNVDESLLCGIAVLKEAQNPIANAFDSVVSETHETLPEVESVLYEDGLGLVGWINGERMLVGSRALLEKYRVRIPDEDYEAKYAQGGKQLTYLSRAGNLVAILVTCYHADPELKSEMQRAEANGISFLIRTTDYNITEDLVAEQYNLFFRSLKILPTGLGNELHDAQSVTEEQSRSYLITRGKAAGLARAVSGCVKIKQNISLAIVIQLIAVILGLLIAIPLVLYAGVSVMGTMEVMIYALFWAIAAIIAPAIQKP